MRELTESPLFFLRRVQPPTLRDGDCSVSLVSGTSGRIEAACRSTGVWYRERISKEMVRNELCAATQLETRGSQLFQDRRVNTEILMWRLLL
jgi:hypothetical protein